MRLLAPALALVVSCTPAAFEDDFLFGAAVAGFQVDPGCPTRTDCIDTKSDWYQWTTSGAQLADLTSLITFEPLENGPGFWELYEHDFELAKNELGLGSFRLSLEWSRIFPNPTDGLEGEALAAAADQRALAAYHAQFAALRARGLTPMVTLNHYTLPVWLHDGVGCHRQLSTCTERGWLDSQRAIREITKYAGFVAREFRDEVDLWATQNEPFAVVLPAYLLPSLARVNPPGLTVKYAEARQVFGALIEAHARMYDAVKANDPTSSVGLVYAMTPTRPRDPEKRNDRRASDNVFYLYNTNFLDGVTLGVLDADWDGQPDGPPLASLVNRMDWLGINFYTRITVAGTSTPTFGSLSPLTTFDPLSADLSEDYPDGLVEMSRWITERYGKPIYVTETGLDAADDESKIESWVIRYVEATKRARLAGADIRGFYFWSMMDNYEWNRGTLMKFGLYAVGPDKRRIAKSGVAAYRDITEHRDVRPELLERVTPR